MITINKKTYILFYFKYMLYFIFLIISIIFIIFQIINNIKAFIFNKLENRYVFLNFIFYFLNIYDI